MDEKKGIFQHCSAHSEKLSWQYLPSNGKLIPNNRLNHLHQGRKTYFTSCATHNPRNFQIRRPSDTLLPVTVTTLTALLYQELLI